MRTVSILMACLALMGATECSEDNDELVGERTCTTEQRSAVIVDVTGELSDIKYVTAQHTRGEVKCLWDAPWEDAGATTQRRYACYEQEPGRYTIRVHLEDETLTETVDVPGDECHVASPPQKLEIELP